VGTLPDPSSARSSTTEHIRKETSMVELLRLREVLGQQKKTSGTLYKAIRDGLMTPPVKLSTRVSAWPAHESDAILRARIAGKTKDEVRALVADLIEKRKSGGAQ
jgi:prophage regulatory protein